MTAEGDNRVLMIKIVKDLMTNIASKKSSLPKLQFCPKNQLPQIPNIISLDIILDLLKFKEITYFKNLISTIEKETKVNKKN